MLQRIRSGLTAMTASGRKVAETVLANPEAAIAWSIADAARLSGVSEPSVMRFCRHLGFDGYSDFRLSLAQAVALHRSPIGLAPTTGQGEALTDPALAAVKNNADRAIAAIHDLVRDTDPDALHRAASILRQARRIELYGHGGSGFVAQDMQHRLSYLGLAAVAYADPALQMFSAVTLTTADCVMVFSFTGITTHAIPNLDIARNAGAKILAMSPAGSPIARMADVNIAVNAYRQKEEQGFLQSERVAMHVMIGAIAELLQDG